MPAVYAGTSEDFTSWEPPRLLAIGTTLRPEAVSTEAAPYFDLGSFLTGAQVDILAISTLVGTAHLGEAGTAATTELARLGNLADVAKDQAAKAHAALRDHAGQVASARSELAWYGGVADSFGIAKSAVGNDVAAWFAVDQVNLYQSNSNANYADRYPAHEPPAPSPVQPAGFKPTEGRPREPATPGTPATPPANAHVPDMPIGPTPPSVPTTPGQPTNTTQTPPPPPVGPSRTTDRPGSALRRSGDLDTRYRPPRYDTNGNNPSPPPPLPRAQIPTDTRPTPVRPGRPTGQPPLPGRPGPTNPTGPIRPTSGGSGTGPTNTVNRTPAGTGTVPHGGSSTGPEDDTHRRAPWLLQDDPDAIWFAGMPAYTDPVVGAEPGGADPRR